MTETPTDDISLHLANHIAHLTYDDLPEHVVAATKLSILDTIAATIAGSKQPGIVETIATLDQWKGKGESTVALWGKRLPAHEAVIANIAMAHALEIDDSHYPAIVHPTAPSLWSALAVAEARGGATGRDLILSVAAGIDLMVRMGLAAPRTLYLGYHTAMFSGFGAVAAAGKLRKLTGETLQNALGIMVSQASATVQAATDGALVKRLQPAFNAADGIRAVDFAECGITGLRNAFEGPYGLYQLFNHSTCDRAILMGELGSKFYGDELTIKRYPTSRCAHGPIEATLALVKAHAIDVANVDRVIVEVSEGCANIAGAPYEVTDGGSQTFAQFNIRYNVAAALLWRDVFVAEIQLDAIVNQDVVALSKRVEVVANPELMGGVAFVPVTVRVLMRDGTELRHTVHSLKGSPENPMTWDEIVEERLMRSARFGVIDFTDDRIEKLKTAIAHLDQMQDVRDILTMLGSDTSPSSAHLSPTAPAVRTGETPSSGANDAIARITQHVAKTTFDDISAAELDATKKSILDLIATTIAGSNAPKTSAVIDMLKAEGGTQQSRVAVYGGRLPAPQAVVANIMMCHALELDDLYDPAVVHANAPAFWSAMATAEARGGVTGREFLTSMIVASDVMCRIGAAAPQTFRLGHHNALLAGFAAVTAGSVLMNTPRHVMHDAYGIAFAQAAASVQALPDGSLVKRLQPAYNARDGLRALAFAANGVTGVQNVLQGKFGFCRLFGHAPCDRDALLKDIGTRFLGAESSIKRFPSSRCTHAPIEAALALRRAETFDLDEIESITCAVSQVCANVAGAPFSPGTEAAQVRAQFSIPYAIASAFVNGDFFIDQISSDMTNPRVLAIAEKVRVESLSEVGDKMTFTPIVLSVRLKSGRQLSHRLESLRGTPVNPLSWDDIVTERLTRCLPYATRKFPDQDIARLISLVQNLENEPDVTAIMNLLA